MADFEKQNEDELTRIVSCMDRNEQRIVAQCLKLDVLLTESYARLVNMAEAIKINFEGRE